MPEAYVVAVKGNLVCSIEPTERFNESPVPRTRLEVGTSLAANFRKTGDIDGEYFFEDAATARTFAALCLQFSKGLVERRLAAIEALPAESCLYRADEQPTEHADAPVGARTATG